MTWSIVRTCRRCGARAEAELRRREDVVRTVHVLIASFEHPEGDDGCPACAPELSDTAPEVLAAYEQAAARARKHRGS